MTLVVAEALNPNKPKIHTWAQLNHDTSWWPIGPPPPPRIKNGASDSSRTLILYHYNECCSYWWAGWSHQTQRQIRMSFEVTSHIRCSGLRNLNKKELVWGESNYWWLLREMRVSVAWVSSGVRTQTGWASLQHTATAPVESELTWHPRIPALCSRSSAQWCSITCICKVEGRNALGIAVLPVQCSALTSVFGRQWVFPSQPPLWLMLDSLFCAIFLLCIPTSEIGWWISVSVLSKTCISINAYA